MLVLGIFIKLVLKQLLSQKRIYIYIFPAFLVFKIRNLSSLVTYFSVSYGRSNCLGFAICAR